MQRYKIIAIVVVVIVVVAAAAVAVSSRDLKERYTAKRRLFLDGLDDIGIEHNEPQGAYYVLIDISCYGYDDDERFCSDLAQYVGVGSVP